MKAATYLPHLCEGICYSPTVRSTFFHHACDPAAKGWPPNVTVPGEILASQSRGQFCFKHDDATFRTLVGRVRRQRRHGGRGEMKEPRAQITSQDFMKIFLDVLG